MASIKSTENLAEIRSRQVIKMGFLATLLVIFFIVALGIFRLGHVHDSLSEIVTHEQVAMEMLFRMQQAARERSVMLYSIASTNDPFERDEQVLKHSRLGGQFVDARQKLLALKLDDAETELIKELGGHVNTNQKLQIQVLEELSLDHFNRAQEILNLHAVPAQNKMLDSISALLDYEIGKSHGSEALLQKQYIQTRFLMLGGGVIAALFVGLIANFINRRMSKLISGLESSARQIQDANISLESLNLAMNHHGIVSITDVHGNITFANENFCKISEYAKEELVGKNHRILKSGIHPDSFFDEMWSTISEGKIWQGEVCNRNKSGGYYWVSSTIVPFLDESGLPFQYISVRTDLTAIKEAEQVLMRGKHELEVLVQERTFELMEREEVLNSITTAAQDAVIMINSNGNITHWNPAAEKMFGYAGAEIMGLNLHRLVAPSRYLEAHNVGFSRFIQSGEGALIGKVTEIEAQRRDGNEFPVEISISSVNVKDSWHAVAIVRDVTVRKLADENLKKLASTDALTGAFNRRQFNEVMNVEIARAKRYGTTFNLIIFDIDHFKHINDTFGHPAGDQVLLKLSLLVSRSIRNTDVFARWGGEEFTILATGGDADSPSGLAEKIRKLIEEYDFADVGKVTCSFGTTEYRNGENEESILKRADNNLYKAKTSGRNCVISD